MRRIEPQGRRASVRNSQVGVAVGVGVEAPSGGPLEEPRLLSIVGIHPCRCPRRSSVRERGHPGNRGAQDMRPGPRARRHHADVLASRAGTSALLQPPDRPPHRPDLQSRATDAEVVVMGESRRQVGRTWCAAAIRARGRVPAPQGPGPLDDAVRDQRHCRTSDAQRRPRNDREDVCPSR